MSEFASRLFLPTLPVLGFIASSKVRASCMSRLKATPSRRISSMTAKVTRSAGVPSALPG